MYLKRAYALVHGGFGAFMQSEQESKMPSISAPQVRQAFPRIIGIRAGKIVYDGPSAKVDQAVLDAIYGEQAGAEECV